MKKSHAGNFTRIKRLRRVLNKLNTAEGIEAVIENEMPSIVDGFTSWLDADIKILKFEELTQNPREEIANLLEYLEINISEEQFDLVLENNSFKSLSGGRSQGKEDDSHHYRKGVHGDWKNHFTDELYELFLSKFEKQIVALGYDV